MPGRERESPVLVSKCISVKKPPEPEHGKTDRILAGSGLRGNGQAQRARPFLRS
jgi:hypothetical protein